MSLYIFLLYHIYHLCFTCIDFYDLSAWSGCWFDVYIRRFIYKFLNVFSFDYTAVAGCGKAGPVNQVNHTSWVAVVTPTDHPKSVSNRCLIELFCGVVCVFTLPFWHFRGCRGFCHRTESDLLLFVGMKNPLIPEHNPLNQNPRVEIQWGQDSILKRATTTDGCTARRWTASYHNSSLDSSLRWAISEAIVNNL